MVIIFDLDGVVYLGNTPLPGAIESLNRLQEAGHALYFLTNNSTRSRQDYVDKLGAMGHRTNAENVMTSAYATGLYLQSIEASGKRVYVVGERGLREEMTVAGLHVVADDDPDPADFVVAGLDRTLTYAKLERAHSEIFDRGATFIATNRDATYPHEEGEIPGGGAMVVPLEYSTGRAAYTIGKPEPHAWLRILELAGVSAPEALMVGDRPETDIMGARALGLQTALVLTGVTTAEVVPQIPEEQRPGHLLRDLTELPALAERLDRSEI